MIVDKINKYLFEKEMILDESLKYEVEKIAGWAFKNQFMNNDEKDSRGRIWFSGVGRCVRQQAYQFHGFEKKGKEIDGRAKIIFWTGDLAELTVVNLAKLAGAQITATGLHQIRISLPVNGGEISGRPDGIIIEGKEMILLEVKSMSSYGFEKFEKGEIDESYIFQVNIGMEALGLSKCCFVALNKDSGVMNERIIEKNPEIVEKARQNVKAIMHSTPENLPDRPYEPNAKGLLPWQCDYCAYHGHCWPEAQKVLVNKSNKLRVASSKETEIV